MTETTLGIEESPLTFADTVLPGELFERGPQK
jgi:hypothetical protein